MNVPSGDTLDRLAQAVIHEAAGAYPTVWMIRRSESRRGRELVSPMLLCHPGAGVTYLHPLAEAAGLPVRHGEWPGVFLSAGQDDETVLYAMLDVVAERCGPNDAAASLKLRWL